MDGIGTQKTFLGCGFSAPGLTLIISTTKSTNTLAELHLGKLIFQIFASPLRSVILLGKVGWDFFGWGKKYRLEERVDWVAMKLLSCEIFFLVLKQYYSKIEDSMMMNYSLINF